MLGYGPSKFCLVFSKVISVCRSDQATVTAVSLICRLNIVVPVLVVVLPAKFTEVTRGMVAPDGVPSERVKAVRSSVPPQ